MTTHDRSRPELDLDLERRLRDWMGTEAVAPDAHELTTLYESVAAATTGARQRPRLLVPPSARGRLEPSERAYPARRVAMIAGTALLLGLLLAIGLVIGSRIPSPQRLPGIFVPTGDVPESVGYLIRPAIAVLDDGRILLAGGGQETGHALVYDPAAGTYGQPIPMAGIRQGATATTLRDGRVLITGGNDGLTGAILATAELFDPATGTFAPTGSMAVARDSHTATLLDDGRVLIVGGQDYPSDPAESTFQVTTDVVEIYDPATGAFAKTGALATGRSGHTATKLPDGRIAVVGGYSTDPSGATSMAATTEIFDPQSGTSTKSGSLATPRSRHQAALLPDGRVFVVGGSTDSDGFGNSSTYVASAELLDPATGEFTPAASLTTERASPTTTLLPDGRVLVLGGNNGFGSPRSAELFDPGRGAFEPAGMMTGEHAFGVAPLLSDGRVFVPGAAQTPFAGSELYVPDVDASAVVASPEPSARADGPFQVVSTPTLRSMHTATRLPDGRVLIVGGQGGDDNLPLASAEIFDPTTGRMTETGSMRAPRLNHVAIDLPDGRVMVVGGDLEATPTAEIFDPATGTFSDADAITAALAKYRVAALSGSSAGRLFLTAAVDDWPPVAVMDAMTGQVSAPTKGCYWRGGAVELDDGRILEGCGADTSAQLYDVVAGTADKIAFDGEIWPQVRLADGRVLAGTRQEGAVEAVRLGSTLVYDPASNAVTNIEPEGTTSPMSGSIADLGDGRLLMVGGNWGNTTDAARLLDTTTWTYRDIDPLLTPRADATATVLLDGRVLIVGGATRSPDRNTPPPPSAELFDPAKLH